VGAHSSRRVHPREGVHVNVGQQVIVTTEDRVRLCLNEHLHSVEQRRSWVAPLGILIALVLSLATTSCRDALSVSKYTWHALFVLLTIACVVWLIARLIRAGSSLSIGDVIDRLKHQGTGAGQGGTRR